MSGRKRAPSASVKWKGDPVDEMLREALEPVLRDLRAAKVMPGRIEGHDWTGDPERPSATVWSRSGSGQGIAVARSASGIERVASLADQMQDWAVEELWGSARATNWPACPRHPGNHPLRAEARADGAWWVCPADEVAIIPVGALSLLP